MATDSPLSDVAPTKLKSAKKRRLSSAWGLIINADKENAPATPENVKVKHSRRSLVKVADLGGLPASAVIATPTVRFSEENDDEAERQEAKRRRSMAPSALAAVVDSVDTQIDAPARNSDGNRRKSVNRRKSIVLNAPPRPKLTSNQLAELYSSCIKLSSENKINQKNTWSLPLIDYIHDVLKTQTEAADSSLETNFQAASCTIDASVKIYSCRVDSVYTETYKVLGGLTRTSRRDDETPAGDEENAETGEGPQEGNNETGEAEPAKKEKKDRPKRKREGAPTLETSVASLNVPLSQLVSIEFAVCPMFKKTSASFDEGGPRGLLLNNIHVSRACQLQLDPTPASDVEPRSRGTRTARATPLVTPEFLSELRESILSKCEGDLANLAKLPICPTFAKFRFGNDEALDDGDPFLPPRLAEASDSDDDAEDQQEQELLQFAATMPALNAAAPSSSGSNGTAPTAFDDAYAAFAEERLMAQLDSAGDEADDNEARELIVMVPVGNDVAGSVGEAVVAANHVSAISDVAALIAETPDNEYCFFDPKLMKNWTGLNHHWRFNTAASKSTTDSATSTAQNGEASTNNGKTKTKRTRRKEFFIDFFNPPDVDIKAEFAPPKKPSMTTLGTAALNKDPSTYLLPPDLHFDVASFGRLFLNANWTAQQVRVARKHAEQTAQQQPVVTVRKEGEQSALPSQEVTAKPEEVLAVGNASDDEHEADSVMSAPLEMLSVEQSASLPPNASLIGAGEVDTTASQPIATLPLMPLGEDGLIAAPKMVEKFDITYAKRAKNVDVKRLKTSIWTELCKPSADDPKKPANPAGMQAPKNFQQVLDLVPRHLPKDMAQDVSVPFCFICLLHLANEKGLRLKDNRETLDTLIVEQVPPKVK